jgi:hypothetical protein
MKRLALLLFVAFALSFSLSAAAQYRYAPVAMPLCIVPSSPG